MNIYVVVVGVAFAVGIASGAGTVKLWADARMSEVEKEAAERIAKGWETAERVNRNALENYQIDLERLRNKPARVVRVCPTVPSVAGGTDSPAESSVDRGDGEDIGPVLSGCLKELYRYRALSDAIKGRDEQDNSPLRGD